MRLRILGCSATACQGFHTTALLVDDDILIDCGSGTGQLTLAEMAGIRHVFLTHAHLDHVLFLPLLSDAALRLRDGPLTVHALPETAEALRRHLFNGVLWPDYTRQPTPEQPYVRFELLHEGDRISLGARHMTALPARHAVPAVGYLLSGPEASFAFSGDSGFCPEFWQRLNQETRLRYLMIETTLRDCDAAAAERGGHTTPSLLAQGMQRLTQPAVLLITHMEADQRSSLQAEIDRRLPDCHARFLQGGEEFQL